MIRVVRLKKGRNTWFCPWFFCDFCGLRIADGRKGNFLHDLDGGEILHTHKDCNREFEADHGGTLYWGELSRLPLYLANNLGVPAQLGRGRDKALVLPNEEPMKVRKRRVKR